MIGDFFNATLRDGETVREGHGKREFLFLLLQKLAFPQIHNDHHFDNHLWKNTAGAIDLAQFNNQFMAECAVHTVILLSVSRQYISWQFLLSPTLHFWCLKLVNIKLQYSNIKKTTTKIRLHNTMRLFSQSMFNMSYSYSLNK